MSYKKNGIGRKQHQYYIDISDIQKTLIGTANQLERITLDNFASSSQSMPQSEQHFSAYILGMAGGEHEAQVMLKFIEQRTGLNI